MLLVDEQEENNTGVEDVSATPDILHLEVMEGALAGKVLGRRTKKKWTVMTLGRLYNRNFCLKEPSISDRHAEFRWQQESKEWWIFDVGSTNGTQVNFVPVGVGGHEVKDEDSIRIGENVLRIKLYPYRCETTTVRDFLAGERRILRKRIIGQTERSTGLMLEKFEEFMEGLRKGQGIVA